MKKTTTYLFLLFAVAAIFSSCSRNNDNVSLRETFSENDKTPFGTYVLRRQLEQLYSENTIHERKHNFTFSMNAISDSGCLYISVCKNLFLSKDDRSAVLNYVSNGNTLFIASENIDTTLLDTLGCATNISPLIINGFSRTMDYTNVSMFPTVSNDNNKYSYYYFRCENYFSKYDSSYAKPLGVNDNGLPNFIVIFYGRGRIYLHCEPRVFGNYFLLQKDNYQYLQNVLAYTSPRPQHVLWDNYYNNHNHKTDDSSGGRGGLSVLLQYPPMAWAFWLLVLLLLLYVLFGGKRKQRIVKFIPPNANSTVAFTETIGRLYYQQKDNKNIADKMITYFLERLRNLYFINTSQLNEVFIEALSRKSLVDKEQVEELFALITTVQQSVKVSNQQLSSLNKQIDKFFKNNV